MSFEKQEAASSILHHFLLYITNISSYVGCLKDQEGTLCLRADKFRESYKFNNFLNLGSRSNQKQSEFSWRKCSSKTYENQSESNYKKSDKKTNDRASVLSNKKSAILLEE